MANSLEPSEKHLVAIARVALEVGRMEWLLENLARDAMYGHPKTAAAVVREVNTEKLIKIVKAALLDLFPDEARNITNLTNGIKAVREERNEIVHWQWGHNADENEPVVAKIRPFHEQEIKPMPLKQINDIAARATDLCRSIQTWQEGCYEKRYRERAEREELERNQVDDGRTRRRFRS